MKNNPLTTVLLGVLTVSALLSVGFCCRYVVNTRELHSIQFKAAGINNERMAINAPVQGTAADLIKVAMIALHRELESRQTDVALLLQVHDELVLDVEEASLEWASETVRRTMQGVADLKVPLLVDLGHGSSWADAKG